MSPRYRIPIAVSLAAMVGAVLVSGAGAQSSSSGCILEPVGGTGRQIVRCGGDLAITAEAGADYEVLDRDGDGAADAVRLDGKAVLVDAPKDGSRAGFEVIAPQAIAAVRGTTWAVDATEAATSVFVVTGEVSVRRVSGGDSVVLGPGEGVDVDSGNDVLVVRRWPAARAAALMARFGQ